MSLRFALLKSLSAATAPLLADWEAVKARKAVIPKTEIDEVQVFVCRRERRNWAQMTALVRGSDVGGGSACDDWSGGAEPGGEHAHLQAPEVGST